MMKKTGMFLAVMLVASLFAGSFALAGIVPVESGASISAEEALPSLTVSDIEESASEDFGGIEITSGTEEVFASGSSVEYFPGLTTIGNGWATGKYAEDDDVFSLFIQGVWTNRKTSEGLTKAYGKLRIAGKTFKLEKTDLTGNGIEVKTAVFRLHGSEGVEGKLYLERTDKIGGMEFWTGTLSFTEGFYDGKVTLASKTHRIRPSIKKPIITTDSADDAEKVVRKPTTSNGVRNVNGGFGNAKPTLTDTTTNTAEKENSGFFGRIWKFFGSKN